MRRIGSLVAAAALATAYGALAPAVAAGPGAVEFTAKVDRAQISMDESVSLKLTVQGEGAFNVGNPKFNAPDFDVVNEYTGTYVESYYDSSTGRFGMRNNQQLTKVLKPSKAGALKIGGISIVANGKTLTAPDITVQVFGSGAGTPPPRGYGGSGLGLRGAGKRTLSGPSVKVRAEVDKDRAYKGEQVIVSYYLYRRVRVFNIQVDKFPMLNGFLREDLDMPVLGQRLDSERVVLDGVPYERSLLIRYAAYPLQEGKHNIDSVGLKYSYYSNSNAMDDEDPFAGFFRQMTPQQGSDRSEHLTVDVIPLPEEGKPQSFTGGVGDFSIASAVDKVEVRANEALTLTLKIEGKGNLAAIGEPKAKWPENVELYDSKGTAKSGRMGVGQKVFEFLLIPRVPGKVTLPAMDFSYFDPGKKEYVTRSTEPIVITVNDPAPGSAITPPRAKGSASDSVGAKPDGSTDKPVIAGLKASDSVSSGLPAWRWLYWAAIAGFIVLAGLIVSDLLRKNKARSDALAQSKAKAHARSWEKLRESARQATQGAAWQEVLQTYEVLVGVVFDAIDQAYDLSARSRPRSQLKQMLVDEKGLPAESWEKISRLLEFAETVRFAASAGVVSEQSARSELARWVSEGEAFSRELRK
jgi:hypothetical protein